MVSLEADHVRGLLVSLREIESPYLRDFLRTLAVEQLCCDWLELRAREADIRETAERECNENWVKHLHDAMAKEGITPQPTLSGNSWEAACRAVTYIKEYAKRFPAGVGHGER